MKLLLCAATEMEIAPTIDFINKKNWPIDVLITGVGLTTTAYSITKAVMQNRPTEIIQAGIAGSFSDSLPLGEVVVIGSDNIGDLGVIENGSFKTIFDMGFVNANANHWRNGELKINHERYRMWGLPVVSAVTVNEITTNAGRVLYYREHLKASVESMEGAALHFVGLMENVTFTQVRAISNFVGERDKSNWKIREAIIKLNAQLQRLLTLDFDI